MSKSVPVAELAANLDALLDEVAQKQEEVVVTKDGQAVARVVPMHGLLPLVDRPWHSRDALHGSVTVLADIVEPLDEAWDANE